jgi:hypothetical protein
MISNLRTFSFPTNTSGIAPKFEGLLKAISPERREAEMKRAD